MSRIAALSDGQPCAIMDANNWRDIDEVGAVQCRLSFPLIIIVIAASIPASVSAATYTDSQGRFSFTIPDRYSASPPPIQQAHPQFYSPTYTPATFTVDAASVPPGATLDALAQERLRQSLAKYQGSSLISSGILGTSIGGREARWFEAVQTIGAFRWQTRFYIVADGDTVVYLDFSASPEHFDAFMSEAVVAIQSFAFAQAAATSTASGTPPARVFFIRRLGDG